MRTFTLRLFPDDNLKLGLQNFIVEKNIAAAAVITCVGSLKQVALRMANEKNATTYTEKFEIVSLVGTLSINGSHLHMAISDRNGLVRGGHLLNGCLIFTTAEIVIAVFDDVTYLREFDDVTGFKELVVKPLE